MNKKISISFVFAICFSLRSSAHAQGILPPQSTSTATTAESLRPLLIGEKVPETLDVIGENGKKRTLLSYKSPLELLVVTFLSPHCDPATNDWPALKRLDEHYKEWRVSFVAVSASSPDMLPGLRNTLQHEKLPWPVLQDEGPVAAALFKITGTPEVVIIDEFAVLRYRGPIALAPHALDTIIGHIETLQDPEPRFDGKCAL